jgi:hypothetical protein
MEEALIKKDLESRTYRKLMVQYGPKLEVGLLEDIEDPGVQLFMFPCGVAYRCRWVQPEHMKGLSIEFHDTMVAHPPRCRDGCAAFLLSPQWQRVMTAYIKDRLQEEGVTT